MKIEYKKELSDLGIAPAMVMAIFSIAVELFNIGYTLYQGIQEARRRQTEQRILEQQELAQLAEMFVSKYPNLTYDEWLGLVKATNIIYPPSDITPEESIDWTKYLPYAILLLIIIGSRK